MPRSTALYAYSFGPLDRGWALLPTVPEFVERIARQYGPDDTEHRTSGRKAQLTDAETPGRAAGWRATTAPDTSRA
jgi:hypothetical protein